MSGTVIEVEGNITASGDISASGEVYSNNIETFWSSFNVDGDVRFATSSYGPNTQGINYYLWARNWTDTTLDSGDPTGDGIHRAEINTGWYVPYKIKVVELVGGFTDGGSSATSAVTMSLFNSSGQITASYDTNNTFTKEFLTSGSVVLNGNRWKAYSQSCNVELLEGQYIFPRIRMTEDLTNLRGQITIKYKRCK